MTTAIGAGSTELSGSDWFLFSLQQLMRRAGQGEHISMTALELGPGLDVAALRSAADRLAVASPVAAARLRRPLFGIPRWQWESDSRVEFPIHEHPAGTRWQDLADQCLAGHVAAPVSFELVPASNGTLLLLQWRHALLDGKGAELFLAEIARLAENPLACARPESWGPQTPRSNDWRDMLWEAEKFKDFHYRRVAMKIRSLGDAAPHAGAVQFHVERYGRAETDRVYARAAEVTRGMFKIGWFLAAAMRAHRKVLAARGEFAESFQASCSVQERKRGSRHPIWQNQVSQFFFALRNDELDDLAGGAERLQQQFADMSRERLEAAFAAISSLFRRLPARFWLWMLHRTTGGYLTSFFFSHTGECLPEYDRFCGAPIENAWHIPTVSQPPGTGIFFGERAGQLTVTYSWREGALRPGEFDILRGQLRQDLLGP